MSQTNGTAATKKKKSPFASLLNWPLVRKLESLVFLAMFLAMPLFAFRVIDSTARQVVLQNSAHDLVKDIRRAKQMAGDKGYDVTVEARKALNGEPPDYVIRHGSEISERILPPKGVSMMGEVTFHSNGQPQSPATFELHFENRSLSIDVDGQGLVSMP